MAENPESGPDPRDEPPPILSPELSPEALAALVDAGNVEGLERALREQQTRLPAVLGELDRVLAQKQGNLAAAIATMLIGQFRVNQANALADRVLAEQETAGTEELVDLAAALIQQDRLRAATRALDAALAKGPRHGRGLYLSARLSARRGDPQTAFDTVARANPKLLGAHGLAAQARWASWAGNERAATGALKQAQKRADEDGLREIAHAQAMGARRTALTDDRGALDLRTAIAIEYGALLLELAQDDTDRGRFDPTPMTYGDAGRLIQRLAPIIARVEATAPADPGTLLFATEGGEVVAAGLARILGRPYRAWRHDRQARDGDWLCMASAGTHPHLPNNAVATLDAALLEGTLRTVALVLPVGWRAPIVPDIIGRLTRDDEFPWQDDEEVDDIYAEIVADEPTDQVKADELVFARQLDRFFPHLRATQTTRAGHQAFVDEIPVPGTR